METGVIHLTRPMYNIGMFTMRKLNSYGITMPTHDLFRLPIRYCSQIFPIMIILAYRLYMLSQFNLLIQYHCQMIALLNIVAFILRVRWLLDKRNKFMMIYLLINLLEMIFYLTKLDDPIPYVNKLSRLHFNLFCIGSCLAFLINDFYEIETTKHKRNIVYQKLSFRDKSLKDNMCPICLDFYDDDPIYYLTKCGHAAHAKCFDKWWEKTNYKRCYFLCENSLDSRT